jgi:hypothetical protein
MTKDFSVRLSMRFDTKVNFGAAEHVQKKLPIRWTEFRVDRSET